MFSYLYEYMVKKGVSQSLGLTPKPTNYEILTWLPQLEPLLFLLLDDHA